MDISRRNFMFATLGAIIATSVSSEIALARTYESKINTIAQFYDAVVQYNIAVPNETTIERDQRQEMLVTTVDELVGFLNTNFDLPTTENIDQFLTELRYVLNNRLHRSDWREVPPIYIETVIPVIVMRDLIAIERIRFDVEKCKNFDTFSDRYLDIILKV